MGQIFNLIADNSLEKLDEYYTECHICSKINVDLYVYNGKYQLENGQIDDDIYAVCRECILTKKLSHICDFEYIQTINKYLLTKNLSIRQKEAIEDELIEKYQRTPDIPIFVQGDDRPLCCNDITEFIGYPADEQDLHEKTENCIYWQKEVKTQSRLYDFRKLGNPESLSDVAIFRCLTCEKKYFTFQFT